MPVLDVITEYAVRYGFQALGAAIVFAAGALVVRLSFCIPIARSL